MADNPQQIDHYDFINAPQFVDFDDLTAQDDPEADRFFDSHREEDDFVIPLDINEISPTVQLLYDETHYVTEANKAAQDAGLDDVKIEYYASPQQQSTVRSQSLTSSGHKKSTSSSYGTPVGESSSGLSCKSDSFYTPTGCENKENQTPPTFGRNSSMKKASHKKISELGPDEDKGLRGILAEKSIILAKDTSITASPQTAKKVVSPKHPTRSLYSQLEKLQIVTSSSEDEDEDIAKAKVPVEAQPENEGNYSTFTEEKRSFLDLPGRKSEEQDIIIDADPGAASSESTDEITLLIPPTSSIRINEEAENLDKSLSSSDEQEEDDISASIELRTPIRNILRKLDAELCLEDENAVRDDPRCSIVVAPSVGQQVLWHNGEAHSSDYGDQHDEEFGTQQGEESFNDEHHDFDISSSSLNPRRASSLGDLPYAIEMQVKERDFKTFGYNPRFGITIPKTPDTEVLESLKAEAVERHSASNKGKILSNNNACYFEIDAPSPVKAKPNLRRVSSCGDLHKFQQKKVTTLTNRHMPLRKKPLTVPRTPETVKRSQKGIKSNVSSASSVGSTSGPKFRGRELTRKPTVTVAERLNAARDRRQPVKANHYVSMAEALINYQKNTPDRFRTLPKGRLPEKRATSCDARKRAAPTPPRSPEFATASRARGTSFQEQKEKKTIGPIPSTSFASGVPKKIELKPTVPKPFNLHSSHRPRIPPTVDTEADTVDFKFKARPAPRMETTFAVKPKHVVKVTQPMSPHFASDDRLRERHQKKAEPTLTPPKTKVGKQPVQKGSRIPTSATRSNVNAHADEHKTTVAQPFSSSFDARQKETLRRKEQKIQKLEQEAKMSKEFHANPVPKFSAKPLKKKPIGATHAEPFRLKSDERGAAYQEAFKRKLEEEEARQRELAQFHAQPAVVLHKPPFEPEKSSKLLETPLEFQLATEKRAAEREEFDEHIRQKEKEEEERRQEEQERLEELRRQEDVERRRQMVHKAQPFREPKPFQPKSSAKPLTVPQSPAFSALPSERRIQADTPPKNTTQ